MVFRRISPWAKYAKEFSASAQAHRELRNRLGLRFREAQQEAQESWAVWDEAMEVVYIDAPEPAPVSILEKATHAVGDLVTAARDIIEQTSKSIRRRVEIWTEPKVQFASPALASRNIQELVIPLDELSLLGLRPHIRVDLRRRVQKSQVHFILERFKDPERPARYIKPKRGIVSIHLIRPAPAEEVKVRLGSYGPDTFKALSDWIVLHDYQDGEEHTWEAEVIVSPGAMWK